MTGRIEVSTMIREAGEVVTLTVDRRDKLNILDSALMKELRAAIENVSDETRAVVLTGAGSRAFIGGADITEMAALDAETARAFISTLHGVAAAIRHAPVPVVACIKGYCFGAGLEIAAACDIRLASSDAQFGMPEVHVGIPSVIEAALLPRLIGSGHARELVMTARRIGVEEALRIGLIDRMAPKAALDDLLEDCLSGLLAAGERALRLQKKLCNDWEELPLRAAIEAGVEAFGEAFKGDEPRRMLSAFLARKRD